MTRSELRAVGKNRYGVYRDVVIWNYDNKWIIDDQYNQFQTTIYDSLDQAADAIDEFCKNK